MSSPILLSVSKNNTAPFVLSLDTKEPFVLRDVNPTGSVTLQMGPNGTGAISLQGPQGEPSIRGLSGFCASFPLSDEIVLYGVAPYDFDIDANECRAVALVPATAQTIFEIFRTDLSEVQEQIGTITFAIGEDTAVFSFTDINILKNEKVFIQAPTVIDETLANITFLLV
jgi:hypothetical protein